MSLRPLAPWHAAHSDAKRCAYSAFAAPADAAPAGCDAFAAVFAAAFDVLLAPVDCASAALPVSSSAASAPAAARMRCRCANASLAAVADPIDRTGVVVADEQRSVLHDVEVDRAAEIVVVLDEAGHERLDLGAALAVGPRHVHAVVLLGPVPRPVDRDEHRALVLRREHLAGVELQAERAGVRPEQRGGLDVVVARLAPAEFRIGDVALVAVRVAEVLAELLHVEVVQLVVRELLAEPVAAVVGEPEVAGLRVEVEADRVAHALRQGLDAGAVEVHAVDLGVLAGIADVARRADREVQLVVLDAQELP